MGRLGIYTRASTANPTGRRPWNSRLSFYENNSFALPTAGLGPFLLQPGVSGRPMANGGVPGPLTPGLSYYERAKFSVPTSSLSGPRRRRLSGLGQTSTTVSAPSGARARRMFAIPSGATPISVSPIAATGSGTSSGWGANYPIISLGPASVPSGGYATPQGQQPSWWQASQQQITQQQGPQLAAQAQGGAFTPIGTTGLYTSAAGLESQAAAQGYYQVGTSRTGQPIYSSNPAAMAQTQGQITSYDALGAPIYSSPPAGATVVGTDAYGTPIYSNNPSAASLIATGTQTSAAAAQAAAAAPAATTTTSVSDWFSQDSLGFGLNNGWYLGIGAAALLIFTSKRR